MPRASPPVESNKTSTESEGEGADSLAIGTLGFLAATAYFLFLMTRAPEGSRHFFIVTAVITGVAALFYLTMSTGATVSVIEARVFY